METTISLWLYMCCRNECYRMRMQGLPADEHLHARPQLLGLPTSSPGRSCHDDCAECRFMPGRGPADRPASHWGEASHAAAHQVGHTQEDRAPLEEHSRPGVCQCPLDALADLACVLHLLCPWVPQATRSPCPARRALLPIGWSNGAPRALLGAK